MRLYSNLKWQMPCMIILIALVLLACPLFIAQAQAQGGIAISGGFYRQSFEIPRGSSVSASSVDVVVFNQGDGDLGVMMSWKAPEGVNVVLSRDEFTLGPGAQQKILVEVQVAEDAIPGVYKDAVVVTAESYTDAAAEGIQLVGSSSQSADLTIPGESAFITAQAVGPDGNPVNCQIRLYRVDGEQIFEIDRSGNGILETRVAPGTFLARAYVGTDMMAEETFEVIADDDKTISLVVETIFFEDFSVLENIDNSSGKLVFVQLVYTVKNLYEPVSNAEVILQVTHDEELLGEYSTGTWDPLDIGRMGLNYTYVPLTGWASGTYGFKLRLNVDGQLYASTLEEKVVVSDGVVVGGNGSDGDNDTGGGLNSIIIGVIIAVVILIIISGTYFMVRRKRLLVGSRDVEEDEGEKSN